MKYSVLLHAPVHKGIILEYSVALAVALESVGVDVVLETGQNGVYIPELSSPRHWVVDQINPTEGLRFRSSRWALNRFTVAFRNSTRRLRLAQLTQAKIVHIQLLLPWVDWLFVRLHQRTSKVVFTVHDVTPHIPKLPIAVDRLLRKSCYRAGDGLIFHSLANLAQFESTYSFTPRRFSTIPVGLSWQGARSETDQIEALARLGLSKRHRVILMFGEMRPNKGLDVLVQAFRQVLVAVPDAFLLIAGGVHPSVKKDAVLDELAELPVDSWRWEQEWITEEDMPDYFHAASVVTLPYTVFTSQSGVLAKAYAYSCPLAVSNIGSLGDTVNADRSGLVVKPTNVSELASALTRLLTDRTLWQDCQENAAKAARDRYSWATVAQQTAAFYDSML